MQTLTLDQFRAIHQTGGIQSVELKPRGSKFELIGQTLRDQVTLVTSRANSNARLFPSITAALNLLRRIGIDKVTIAGLMGWQPEKANSERARRPDRQEALQRAADHDRWFRAQVQESLDDTRAPVAPDEWARIKAAQLAKAKALGGA